MPRKCSPTTSSRKSSVSTSATPSRPLRCTATAGSRSRPMSSRHGREDRIARRPRRIRRPHPYRGAPSPGSEWRAADIGPAQITLSDGPVAAGGHARTGLKDYVRLDRITLALSNAALVARVVETCNRHALPVGPPAQAHAAWPHPALAPKLPLGPNTPAGSMPRHPAGRTRGRPLPHSDQLALFPNTPAGGSDISKGAQPEKVAIRR